MKKALAALAALLVGTVLSLTGAGSAHANVEYLTKWDCSGDGFSCMTVTFYKDTLHSGITVVKVNGRCTTGGSGPVFGWDSPALDGHSMVATNDTTGVDYWSLGEGSNVYDTGGGVCSTDFPVGVDRPNSHQVTIAWTITEQFNFQPDSGKTLSVTLYNS